MRKIIVLLFLFISANLVFAQCPPEGNGKTEKEKQFNKLKNREIKAKKINKKITLDSLLKVGNDTVRFKNTDYVSITGFVVAIEYGGKESCNCDNDKKIENDIHLYIGKTKDAPKSECLIVEITPALKKLNQALSMSGLKGKKVKIDGYLFFDYEHKGNASNTCKKCTKVWRKTCWEIHPVVKLEIIKT